MAARFEGWLFGPESPARLRVCRVGLLLVVALRVAAPPYHELGGQPRSLFDPPWFLTWLPAMPPGRALVALQVAGLLAVGLGLAGPARRRRVAFVVAWASLLVLAGLRASRGKIMHNDLLLLFACVPFLAGPFDERSAEDLEPSAMHGWPIRAAWVVVAVAYFRAGLGKLLTSGLEWVFSDNMRWIQLNAIRRGRAPTDAVSTFVYERPWLAVSAAALLLAFELSAPLVLVSARFRVGFALAAAGLHLGTWLTIGLDYSAWALTVGLVLVDWPAVLRRRRRAGLLGPQHHRRAEVGTP
ncbi:MAG: hypothetical protein H0U89_05165 [Acidimicrobiia bacterium]|nr:hypothetical protein [Acidimicrobiia bacterium]